MGSAGDIVARQRRWPIRVLWRGQWQVGILTQVVAANCIWIRPPARLAGIRTGNCNAMFALRPDSSVVERGPEKAGVGGSIPSLATTLNADT